MSVGIISAHSLDVQRLPILSKLMKNEVSNLALKQAVFPIPDIPDDFEVSWRRYIYNKYYGTLIGFDLLFNTKVSKRWNSAVTEIRSLVSIDGGEKQAGNTTYLLAVNYTKDEKIEYIATTWKECRTTKIAPTSIER